MKLSKTFFIGLLGYWLVGLFFFGLPQKSYAQSYSLSITPSLVELLIKPGKSVSQVFKITNNGDPTVITPHITSFTPDQTTGKISFTAEMENATSSSWFSLGYPDLILDKAFFLNTNSSQLLNLKIDLPETTTTGDYYFLFKVDSSAPPQEKTSGSALIASIGSNILISVSHLGTLNKNGQISRFSVPLLVDSFDPLDIFLSIKNTGSAYFKPLGNLTLKSLFLSSNYKILPQNILVASQKTLQTENSLIDNNLGQKNETLSLKGFFFGPYSLSADVTIDGTHIQLKKTVHFFAFPYKLSLIALILIVILKKGKKWIL